jgi:hypothetical protein
MRVKNTTGLLVEEFAEIIVRIKQILESRHTGRAGAPHILSLCDQFRVTLLLLRQNVTEEFMAGVYGVSQSTISRAKDRIEPLIGEALAMSGHSLADVGKGRIVVVDGTYVPTGNRKQTGKTNYSGKRHCQCLNIQVASDLDGNLLAVSDPVPGARHDAKALKLCGWDEELENLQWLADTAYIATNAFTPIKKHMGEERTEADKKYNHDISSHRAAIERCNALLKNWKILKTGYRRQLKKLPHIIKLITNLELYRLGW